ncbi:MAG: hypothetical protein AAF050_00635 [Cyanobacteria bacterium J06649_5]
MSDILVIDGEKGGVGKSNITRAIVEYLSLTGLEFKLIEADAHIPDVANFFKGKSFNLSTITLSDHPERYSAPDIIFKTAQASRVIVNLPSNTQGVLDSWIRSNRILELADEYAVKVFKIFVTDGSYESIKLLNRSVKDFNGGIQHIIVLNKGRLNGLDFAYLEKKTPYIEIVNSPNVLGILEFPRLESNEQYYVDENELSLTDAIKAIQKEQGILAAQRIKTHLEKITKLFSRIDFSEDLKLKPESIEGGKAKGEKVKPPKRVSKEALAEKK